MRNCDLQFRAPKTLHHTQIVCDIHLFAQLFRNTFREIILHAIECYKIIN